MPELRGFGLFIINYMSQLNTALSGSDYLGPLRLYSDFVLPTVNWQYISDVHVSFSGALPDQASPALSNALIKYGGKDVTAAYVRLLKEELVRPDRSSKYLDQYLQAATQQLDLYASLSPHFTIPKDRDNALIQNVKSSSSLAPVLGSLGDSNFGWGGRLHPFHYLFSKIQLPPVSLKQMLIYSGLATSVGSNSFDSDFGWFEITTDSRGPLNEPQLVEGGFHYSFELVYDNPLDEPIHNIQQAVEPGQHLDIVVTDIKNKTAKLLARIEQCNDQLGDVHLAEALRDTLDELKQRLKL